MWIKKTNLAYVVFTFIGFNITSAQHIKNASSLQYQPEQYQYWDTDIMHADVNISQTA